jgi:hypothetical protein
VIAGARWLIVVIALFGAVLDVLSLAGVTRPAIIGVGPPTILTGYSRAFVRVSGVSPGSSGERAGVRTGDAIRFASPADAAIHAAAVRGAIVHVQRSDGTTLAIPLEPVPLEPAFALYLVVGAFMAIFSFVLAVRAWGDVQARRLAVGLVWIAYYGAQINASPAWSLLGVAGDFSIAVGMAGLVLFATGWAATPVRVRALRPAAMALAAVYAALNVSVDLGLLPVVQSRPAAVALWCVLAAAMIGGLATSMVNARGIERRRIGWILVTLTVTFAPWIAYEIALAAGIVQQPWLLLGITGLALPFGFAYAMLRHRVVDLGFALNRAAVFAATTALLVGLFGAMQWGADQLLVQATRAQGFAVQMAIAVIVLYAVRFLRAQADALVARLFFAKRQRRIASIRALAHAIDAVESPASLAPYIVEQLHADTGIASSLYVEGDDAFVRAAGDQGPAQVSRDNPTVIALRATSAPVAIRAESDLIGAIAFPLTVRGRLRGALVCDLPSADEDFAPDERAALADLAVHACVVREDLLAEQLRAELTESRAALARLTGGGVTPLGRATSPFALE